MAQAMIKNRKMQSAGTSVSIKFKDGTAHFEHVSKDMKIGSDELVIGYWNIRGLGQAIRMMAEYVGADYREDLYNQGPGPEFSNKEWLDVKHTLGYDFPNLPYLKDGLTYLTETVAILKYIARKFDPSLIGKTPKE